jgi:hypothetical protein
VRRKKRKRRKRRKKLQDRVIKCSRSDTPIIYPCFDLLHPSMLRPHGLRQHRAPHHLHLRRHKCRHPWCILRPRRRRLVRAKSGWFGSGRLELRCGWGQHKFDCSFRRFSMERLCENGLYLLSIILIVEVA